MMNAEVNAVAMEFTAAEAMKRWSDMQNVATDPLQRVQQLTERANILARYDAAKAAYDAMIAALAKGPSTASATETERSE